MIDHDLKYMHSMKLIKQDFDSKSVPAFFRRNSSKLKELFYSLTIAGG